MLFIDGLGGVALQELVKCLRCRCAGQLRAGVVNLLVRQLIEQGQLVAVFQVVGSVDNSD